MPELPRFSILDLAPIPEGETAATALRNSIDLAQHAEAMGFTRYWVAEHHNIPGVASAATALLIGQIAASTAQIRVGAGGIMLPNHAPLVIAEQFGTLAALFPGRIDLGLGRAPGGDQATAWALRRSLRGGDDFASDLAELRAFLAPGQPGQVVRAIPGEGADVPIYLLGSSDFGARLAAELGLPFAFAAHFAPDHLFAALRIYRTQFQPSATLDRPYVLVGVNAVAAETDAEAHRLFTSLQQAFLGLVRGRRGPLLRPVARMDGLWSDPERAQVARMTQVAAVGGADAVRQGLAAISEATGADELLLTSMIHDHGARRRSYEILAEVHRWLGNADSGAGTPSDEPAACCA